MIASSVSVSALEHPRQGRGPRRAIEPIEAEGDVVGNAAQRQHIAPGQRGGRAREDHQHAGRAALALDRDGSRERTPSSLYLSCHGASSSSVQQSCAMLQLAGAQRRADHAARSGR